MNSKYKHIFTIIISVATGLTVGLLFKWRFKDFEQKNSRIELIKSLDNRESNLQTLYFEKSTLIYNRQTKSFCLGVLLDQYDVLTAAHCISKMERPQNLEVFTFTLSSQKNHRQTVKQIVFHPEYQDSNSAQMAGTNQHDLVVLRLGFERLKTQSTPTQIGDPNHADGKDSIAVIIGELNDNLATDIQSLSAEHWPIRAAVGYLDPNSISETEFIVRSDETTEDCHGASGSPIFTIKHKQLILLGILSRGPPSCEFRVYTNYREIKHFYDYAKTQLK